MKYCAPLAGTITPPQSKQPSCHPASRDFACQDLRKSTPALIAIIANRK